MSQRSTLKNLSKPCGDLQNRIASPYLNRFSHIYVEKSAVNYDSAKRILKRLNESKIVYIDNYKEIFNRTRQNYIIQKKSQNLILAVEKNNYIYKGSEMCEDFGEKNFYYSSSILNCIFDCQYCYLKGLYTSSNVVIFVNVDDFINNALEKSKDDKVYLCISYDSDLLAFENITGFLHKWIKAAEGNKNLLIEVRTKSSNFDYIKDISIPENIIFAWSILPEEVIKKYEFKTPSLRKRLESINTAIMNNISVRLSIEPIMKVESFREVYSKFIDDIFKVVDKNKVRDINIGTFRIKNDQLKKIRKLNPYSNIFSYKLIQIQDYSTYEDSEEIKKYISSLLRNYVDEGKIF